MSQFPFTTADVSMQVLVGICLASIPISTCGYKQSI